MKKVILSLLLGILFAAGFISWKFFGPTISTPHGEFFYVRTGENFQGVKDSLVSEHYLKGIMWFDMLAKWTGYNYKKVKAGRYKITKGMSLFQLVRMLKNGRQIPVNFVITKFRTKEDFAKKTGSMFECDSLQVIGFMNNADSLKQYGVDSNTVMSLVIPDTYTYFWNTTPERIFTKIYEGHQRFWTDDRKKKAKERGLMPTQVYILASIIEEETNAKTDKPLIASVYKNRLSRGIPLQADPTIKFAMKDFGLKRIYQKYLSIESPYNTYQNKGLPPGPICTPSKGTIDAVLDSPDTDYLYFVAKSDLSGTHVFTSKYDEHMKYAREYQGILNKLDSVNNAKQANP